MNNTLFTYSIISFVLFFLCAKISYKLNFVDLPNKRKIHSKATAYTGGIVISVILLIALQLFDLFFYLDKNLNLILSMAFLISLVGLIDDKFNLNAEPLGIKKKLGLKGKMVVFVGALGPWHGIEELGQIANNNPSINVIVAGGGYGENMPNTDNLHHIGRLNRNEVPRLLVEADIGLAPYPNIDYGFSPLKIYEYMGCKLPVVATLLPSVEEATQGHALLVRPGQMSDAISKVIDNENLLSELANSAFSYASKERTWSCTY